MNKHLHTLKYLFFDFLSAGAAWMLFYVFRKLVIESRIFGYTVLLEFGDRFWLGLVFIPLFWLLLYYLAGFYHNVCRRSRLQELGLSLLITIIGVTIIFFTLILDDTVSSYRNYYLSYFMLLGAHFFLSYIPRLIITSRTLDKIQKRKIGFNTLIIGGNGKATDIYHELEAQPEGSGNRFVGFIHSHPDVQLARTTGLPYLGTIDELPVIMENHKAEEVIIAIESFEHKDLEEILNRLERYDITIKIIPSLYDILTGKVRMTSLFGTPLIQVSRRMMPAWQGNLKRLLDVFLSVFCLVLLLPVCLLLALLIKLGSKGPVIYSHERIGRFGKPFRIYKFRSMIKNAEENGPQLSSKDDPRITPIGRFMRRTRLDEIPNFYNVILGDMSLVGPRPERQHFIDQIVERAPHYIHLHKVKPGITSWGQVKYGYAESVDQMVQRMRYDLIYIENMSIYMDLKIIIYTLITIMKGNGV